jgi:hypothetical protein
VYVKACDVPPAITALAGTGPLSAFGFAEPILIGLTIDTPFAVAWPLFDTVTTSVYACPNDIVPGVNAAVATCRVGTDWICTPAEVVALLAPPVEACACALNTAVPELLKLYRNVKSADVPPANTATFAGTIACKVPGPARPSTS